MSCHISLKFYKKLKKPFAISKKQLFPFHIHFFLNYFVYNTVDLNSLSSEFNLMNKGISAKFLLIYRLYRKKCRRCMKLFERVDLVMHAGPLLYHVSCFSCHYCDKKFITGENFFVNNDEIYCGAECIDAVWIYWFPTSKTSDIFKVFLKQIMFYWYLLT